MPSPTGERMRAAAWQLHNDCEIAAGGMGVDERPLEPNQAAQRDYAWIPAAALSELRVVITRYLDGRRDLEADVERVAAALAMAAHDAGYAPERMLISLRALWREFTFSQL